MSILAIILILFLLGAFGAGFHPYYGYSYGWPGGGLGLVLIIVLILALAGRL